MTFHDHIGHAAATEHGRRALRSAVSLGERQEAWATGGGANFRWLALISGFSSADQSCCFVQQSLLNTSVISLWSVEWPWAYSRKRNLRSAQCMDLASWKQCCRSVCRMDLAVKELRKCFNFVLLLFYILYCFKTQSKSFRSKQTLMDAYVCEATALSPK